MYIIMPCTKEKQVLHINENECVSQEIGDGKKQQQTGVPLWLGHAFVHCHSLHRARNKADDQLRSIPSSQCMFVMLPLRPPSPLSRPSPLWSGEAASSLQTSVTTGAIFRFSGLAQAGRTCELLAFRPKGGGGGVHSCGCGMGCLPRAAPRSGSAMGHGPGPWPGLSLSGAVRSPSPACGVGDRRRPSRWCGPWARRGWA